MDEKKIVYKSIEEQLVEDERRNAAEAASSRKSSDMAIEKAAMGSKRGRKKLRLKKSARRTIGSLLLATSVIVAAVPVGGVSAVTENYNDGYEEANYISETEVTLPDVNAILADTSLDGHVNDTAISVPAGGDGRYGFPLKLVYDSVSDQMKPETIKINGHTYSYVDTSVYLSADNTVEPLFLIDNSNSKIKKCLQPTNFIANEISLDCYYGYSENETPETAEIFVEDGVSYKWEVEKQTAGLSQRYVAQKYYWQENVTSSPKLLMEPPTEEESSEADEENDIESVTTTPTPTPDADKSEDNSEAESNGGEADNANPSLPFDESDSTTTPEPEKDSSSNPPSDEPSTEIVESETAGAPLSFSGIVRVATVDDPSTGRWVEDGDPIVLCRNNATYNQICDNSFTAIPQSIRTVTIPDYSNLTKVGNNAFEGTAITSINLVGNNIESLGVKSFANCSGLSTVKLGDAIQNIGDGAFAGDAIKEIHIPHATNIGCASFYGNSLTNVDVSECVGVKVGDYSFANNKSLSAVDLDYKTQDKNTIANLDKLKGLFAGCSALSSVSLPTYFEGTLQSGIFQNCMGITTFVVRNSKADFTGGEFDRTKINVYGPDPENLDPESTKGVVGTVNAYNTCLGWTTGSPSYSYDYRYNACNLPIGYNGSNSVPTLNTVHKYCNNYIENGTGKVYPKTVMQIDGSEFISGKFERAGGPEPYTLVIDGGVGVEPNTYNISGINSEVFKDDNHLKGVRIGDKYNNSYSLSYIGEKAFYNCPYLEDIFVNVNATTLSKECFANNNAVKSIELGRAGGDPSNIGERAFYNCGTSTYELPVSFVNDDLRYGSEGDYAVIGAIGNDAFSHDNRTVSIVFKGPFENTDGSRYMPFDYAISPAKVGQGNYYIKYKSGNPRNLECIYKLNWSAGGVDYPTGVYLLSYPNMTSHLGSDDKYPSYGDEVSPRDLETIRANYPSTGYSDNTTDIENLCVEYTKNIVVPDGIDYIDIAESEILDVICPNANSEYLEIHPMYYDPTDPKAKEYKTYSEVSGNYDDTCPHSTVNPLNAVYKQFRYVKDLEQVTFNGQQIFPDKMFEASSDLTRVDFGKDVINLGDLPFYLRDTEGDNTTGHLKRSPSVVYEVYFHNESDATTNNPKYYGTESGLNQMIVSDDSKKVYLEQIFPLRGTDKDYNPSYTEGDKIFSISEINNVVKSGLDEIKQEAARDCDKLVKIQLNDSSKGLLIREKAFYDCDDLAQIFFPDQVNTVEKDAFGHINNKTLNVYLPSRDTTFANGTFSPTNNEHNYPEAYLWGPDDEKAIKKYTEYIDDISGANFNVHFDIDPDLNKPWVKFIIGTREVDSIQIENGTNVKTYIRTTVDPKWNPDGKYKWVGTDQVTMEYPIDPGENLKHNTNFYAEEIKQWTVTFAYPDGVEISTTTVADGEKVPEDEVPKASEMRKLVNGKAFSGVWAPSISSKITKNTTIVAQYDEDPGSSSSSSSTSSSTSTTSSTGGGGGTSGSSSRSSSSSSSSRSSSSSSSSSSTALPVFVNSQDAGAAGTVASPGVNSTVYVGEGSGSGSTGSGSGNGRGSGNTTVISITGGITDTGKISATVNGSSDNYVIKITQTQEADDAGLSALHGKYGDDISAIRYLPFDISLYDSTGTNKISPVPEGVSVSITMPIPDDLAIYGGNAKIASTAGGVLDPMTPRFTVINGVPCMTYTCTHFSPYMVWVDTANLTEAGIMDATPKTADGIHPKWFLCFGLAALAVVMFLKKDPEEYLKKKAA